MMSPLVWAHCFEVILEILDECVTWFLEHKPDILCQAGLLHHALGPQGSGFHQCRGLRLNPRRNMHVRPHVWHLEFHNWSSTSKGDVSVKNR